MIQLEILLSLKMHFFLPTTHSETVANNTCCTCTAPSRASHLQGRVMLPDTGVCCEQSVLLMAVSWIWPSLISAAQRQQHTTS